MFSIYRITDHNNYGRTRTEYKDWAWLLMDAVVAWPSAALLAFYLLE